MVDTAQLRSQISAGRTQVQQTRQTIQQQQLAPVSRQVLQKRTAQGLVKRGIQKQQFGIAKEQQLSEFEKQAIAQEAKFKEAESQIASYEAAQTEAAQWSGTEVS